MSEFKGTPGPWRFEKSWVVADFPPAGRPTDEKEPEWYSGGYVIAETVTPENGPLIAAAPRLLNALQCLGKEYEQDGGRWHLPSCSVVRIIEFAERDLKQPYDGLASCLPPCSEARAAIAATLGEPS